MRKYREIVSTMDEHSRQIFNSKKAALERGDESVVQQLGEGRDIMSILSQCRAYPDSHTTYLIPHTSY